MIVISKQFWFYLICLVFVSINMVAIAMDFPWIGLLPFILIFCYLILFKLDSLILLLAFLVPLSVGFDNVGFGLGISLPDEPLIIVIMVLSIFKFVINAQYDFRVLKHPISIAILFNLFWLIVTTCTSDYPIVSLKYVMSRLWYLIVFYFLGMMLFREYKNITKYLWLYIISLFGVVVFILIKHSEFNFSLAKSYSIVEPFFVDHGIYAATISLFIPLLACYVFFFRRMGLNLIGLIVTATFLAVFFAGVYFSYTRAAWISVLVSSCFVVPVLLRIKFKTVVIVIFTSVSFVYIFQNQILYVLSKNQQKSANGFSNHFQSISNIKTDPSNTERINRWMSAIAMFENRPVLGFGPGTYSFCYAPYQQYKYKTVISTNFGDGGNSHSEYLNPLAESGLFGLLSFLAIIYLVLNTGFKLYFNAKKFKVRIISLGISLGLITYFVHGFLNNYSATDKIGAVLWAAFGMITALDVYHNKQKTKSEPQ